MGNSASRDLLSTIITSCKDWEIEKVESLASSCDGGELKKAFTDNLGDTGKEQFKKFKKLIEQNDLNLFPKQSKGDAATTEEQKKSSLINESIIAGFENPKTYIEWFKARGI